MRHSGLPLLPIIGPCGMKRGRRIYQYPFVPYFQSQGVRWKLRQRHGNQLSGLTSPSDEDGNVLLAIVFIGHR